MDVVVLGEPARRPRRGASRRRRTSRRSSRAYGSVGLAALDLEQRAGELLDPDHVGEVLDDRLLLVARELRRGPSPVEVVDRPLIADALVQHALEVHVRILLHTAGVGFAQRLTGHVRSADALRRGVPRRGRLRRRRRRRHPLRHPGPRRDHVGSRPVRAASPTSTRIRPTRAHLVGFEVDIMDAIARRLGVKARMVQYNWSNLVPSLERGDFDIVMNGLEATPGRARTHPAVASRTTSTPRRSRCGPAARTTSLADLGGQAGRHAQPDATRTTSCARSRSTVGAVRGRRGALHRPRAGPGRRGAARQHHRGSLRLRATSTWSHVPAGRRRARHVRRRHAASGDADLAARDRLARCARCARTASSSASCASADMWDDRQTSPADRSIGRRRRQPRAHVRPRRCSGSSSWSALVTLELSVLAFLLAVPLGARARDRARLRRPRVARASRASTSSCSAARRCCSSCSSSTTALATVWSLGRSGRGARPRAQLRRVRGRGLPRRAARDPARPDRGRQGARPRGRVQILRHVLMPQAFRLALPPMTNDFVVAAQGLARWSA